MLWFVLRMKEIKGSSRVYWITRLQGFPEKNLDYRVLQGTFKGFHQNPENLRFPSTNP